MSASRCCALGEICEHPHEQVRRSVVPPLTPDRTVPQVTVVSDMIHAAWRCRATVVLSWALHSLHIKRGARF
jgi:hypothetical protein